MKKIIVLFSVTFFGLLLLYTADTCIQGIFYKNSNIDFVVGSVPNFLLAYHKYIYCFISLLSSIIDAIIWNMNAW